MLSHFLRRLEDEIPNIELFRLLNINKNEEILDSNAIIEEIRQNPQSAAIKYEFLIYLETGNLKCKCYPLHRAIHLRANTDVLETIYNSYPPAIEERAGELSFNKALYSALLYRDIPLEIPLFILNKHPHAALEVELGTGITPLYCAVCHGAKFEIVSLLLQLWPGAAMAKNFQGMTPLHVATSRQAFLTAPGEVVSLLLHYYPRAARIKDVLGRTPLHHAYEGNASLQVVLALIEKWPFAVTERNCMGKTPLDVYKRGPFKADEGIIRVVMSYIYEVYNDGDDGSVLDNNLCKGMMDFFISIQWWNGLFLVFDRRPLLTKQMNLKINIFPNFLSAVGRYCNIKTMWWLIYNELDILEGV